MAVNFFCQVEFGFRIQDLFQSLPRPDFEAFFQVVVAGPGRKGASNGVSIVDIKAPFNYTHLLFFAEISKKDSSGAKISSRVKKMGALTV